MDTYTDIVYNNTEYDVTSYLPSVFIEVRKAEISAAEGFESDFGGAAFCLAQPIGGLLVYCNAVTCFELQTHNGS